MADKAQRTVKNLIERHSDAKHHLLKLARRCARAYGVIDRLILGERDRWGLWVPVALGVGIAIYFSLSVEPSFQSLIPGAGLALFPLTMSFFMRLPHLAHTSLVFCCVVVLGFCAVKVRTETVRAPVIERELEFVRIQGHLLAIKSGADGKARLVIAPTSIGYLPKNETPKKIRVSYRGDTTGLLPGQLIRVRGSLMPPPVPVSPYGVDFARKAWFDGLGGLGFSFGRIDIIDDTPSGGLAMRASIKVAAFRNRVSQHIRTKLDGDTGAMAAALITGDRSGVPPGHTDALRDASLAHLLAISGSTWALPAGPFMGWCVSFITVANFGSAFADQKDGCWRRALRRSFLSHFVRSIDLFTKSFHHDRSDADSHHGRPPSFHVA